MPRFAQPILTTLCLCALTTPGAAQAPDLPPELAAVRAGLEKYQDPVMAVHDGYLSTLACIDFPKGASEGSMQYVAGGMGVHFINMQNVGPTLDPTKPQVLMYVPEAGGKLRLVAAEWFAPVAVVGEGNPPPSVFGKQLQGPMEGHEPLMPPELHHYDLHVWLWQNNPAGVYSPTNPSVSCPDSSPYTFHEDAPKMVHKH
jgi:hypothetical protein